MRKFARLPIGRGLRSPWTTRNSHGWWRSVMAQQPYRAQTRAVWKIFDEVRSSFVRPSLSAIVSIDCSASLSHNG